MVAVKTFLDLAPKKLKDENLNLDQLRNPDYWKEYYVKVQGQMDKVVNLLSDLGESVEKPSFEFPDKLKPFTVAQEAFSGLHDQYARKGIKFENHLPETLPALTVDGPKFRKLFELMLQEELSSTLSGGTVTLSGKALGGGELPQEVEITVSDNGPGLPAESLRSVFDPFYVRSGNPQEVGLSLMTCFFIIYHHGGKIEVRNSKTGLCYVMTVPVQPVLRGPIDEERDLFKRVLLNEQLWEKLLTGE
jgi:signal transduction histidine kinase